ncbi:hypothetical protein AVEN_51630-1 [Araneus ventricosus]|uniref:Uncharacterized protein n=1 Tax=Araneus ventricosus TaxID=182803 RepID=A0A4Y2U0A5_ARAVE|nr:hypothetical protein AVEN_51630-1 [Araneus ventricosus]
MNFSSLSFDLSVEADPLWSRPAHKSPLTYCRMGVRLEAAALSEALNPRALSNLTDVSSLKDEIDLNGIRDPASMLRSLLTTHSGEVSYMAGVVRFIPGMEKREGRGEKGRREDLRLNAHECVKHYEQLSCRVLACLHCRRTRLGEFLPSKVF